MAAGPSLANIAEPRFGGRFLLAFAAYNFLIHLLFALLWLPALAHREFRGRFLNRLGLRLPRLKKSIWLHSPSVGEALAIRFFVARLREAFPDFEIVLTTFTSGGRHVAKHVAADHHLALPYDLYPSVLLTLRALKPALFLVVEGDYWPNLVFNLQRRRVPVVAVNGRVSPRALARQRKVSWFTKPLFRNLALVCAADKEYVPAYMALGVPPERVVVTGNLKYDNLRAEADGALIARVAGALGGPRPEDVLIAASTHGGEEEMVAAIYDRLRRDRPTLKLFVAPRHVERAPEVATTLKRRGLAAVLRSGPLTGPPADAVVLDTLGELAALYPLGAVAVIGGTFVPRGGQNMVEAAYHGCVVVWGPHVENFPAETGRLEGRGGVAVKDADGLYAVLAELYRYDEVRRRLGEEAGETARAMVGASARTLDVLKLYMGAAS